MLMINSIFYRLLLFLATASFKDLPGLNLGVTVAEILISLPVLGW